MRQSSDSTRRFRQIALQLEELIRSGEWGVGTRVPAERELIKVLGVSRTALREALILLELKGLVEIRVGAGTYVLKRTEDTSPPGDAPEIKGAKPFQLLAARRIIEAETSRLAAISSTEEDLKKMREALDQMENDKEPYMLRHVSDRAFHLAIATATRNPALVFVVSAYWDQYRKCIMDHASSEARKPENKAPALADHRAIYYCIEQRDAEGAARAMQAHLDRVGRFLSSFPPTAQP